SNADRTVEVEMRDIAFSPTSIDVRAGETVRFNFKNTGQVTHDAFIGDTAAQEAHEKQMRDGHDHGKEANAVSVKPGKSASLTHTFDKAGQLLIGCHEPGHYTGGMRITVNIA
ncbi:MAG TPA: plastocyanin/azurin family copper-binding protein, partial [Acidimicrobiales bacterium]|nr:plastocyanin/azurin family copper-binding protein [Acidimicrobiales bacterium]